MCTVTRVTSSLFARFERSYHVDLTYEYGVRRRITISWRHAYVETLRVALVHFASRRAVSARVCEFATLLYPLFLYPPPFSFVCRPLTKDALCALQPVTGTYTQRASANIVSHFANDVATRKLRSSRASRRREATEATTRSHDPIRLGKRPCRHFFERTSSLVR